MTRPRRTRRATDLMGEETRPSPKEKYEWSPRQKEELRDKFCRAAEDKIRAVLLWVDEELIETGFSVAGVRADTRNFANMAVTVETEPRKERR